jgi:hypothetical protein
LNNLKVLTYKKQIEIDNINIYLHKIQNIISKYQKIVVIYIFTPKLIITVLELILISFGISIFILYLKILV